MGQHKHNPTALAAARGDIKKSDRVRRHGSQGYAGTSRSVLAITDVLGKPKYVQDGPVIRRRWAKVRSKANLKRLKAQRRMARESTERMAGA